MVAPLCINACIVQDDEGCAREHVRSVPFYPHAFQDVEIRVVHPARQSRGLPVILPKILVGSFTLSDAVCRVQKVEPVKVGREAQGKVVVDLVFRLLVRPGATY